MKAITSYAFLALVSSIIVICDAKPPVPEDIGTNFFLKASKSVPRIGRRNMEYENYFLKASKSIPRIGRRTYNENDWFAKYLQEPVKRSFFEKYFKENESPVWTDLDKVYQIYPGMYLAEEPYPEGLHPKSDPYYPRTKKNQEVVEEQPQSQN